MSSALLLAQESNMGLRSVGINVTVLLFVVGCICGPIQACFQVSDPAVSPYVVASPQEQFSLGFTGVEVAGAGIQIQAIDPNGPFSRLRTPGNPYSQTMTAEAGDFLVAINGVPTTSMTALQGQLAALVQTNGYCVITLRNIRTGVNENFETTAIRIGSSNPVNPNPPSYTLQITGEGIPGQGIRVIQIVPDGVAARLRDPLNPAGGNIYLDPGDIIIAINGKPTRSAEEYQAALAALQSTSGRMQLTIIDVRTGQQRMLQGVASTDADPNLGPGNNPNPNLSVRKIHIIVCGQSGTSREAFNTCIRRSLQELDQMLTRIDDQFVASKLILRDADCNANTIRNRLQNLRVSPEDTIFFYYTGHGAQDSNGHFLQTSATSGNDLRRTEITELIQRHNARLSVIITESCNAAATFKTKEVPSMSRYRSAGPTKLEELLLSYRGLIDINSADDGQYGWGNPTHGGFFSKFFTEDLLVLEPGQADWNGVINTIGQKTNAFFQERRMEEINFGRAPQEMRNQISLTPKIFSLQAIRDPNQFNLGEREFTTIIFRSMRME